MVGIISNSSAMTAQTNLSRANLDSASSISRLSSGNRISRAADDVAGLAVGTILQTNVSTLKAALSNTAQAGSLLGVADGALKNIGDILQRQKALASQSTSGSLDAAARGFLDQEFQALKSEIDRIVDSTIFNGKKLIDGSLFSPAAVVSGVKQDATYTSGTVKIANAFASAEKIKFTAADGNSVQFEFKTTANLSGTDTELQIDMTVNATAAQQASALLGKINHIKNYQGSDATILAAKATLGQLDFTLATDTFTVTSLASGVAANTAVKVEHTGAGNDEVDLNGTAINGSTDTALSTGGTAAVNGELQSGSFGGTATGYGTGANVARTIAQGRITDSILNALTVNAQGTTGFDTSGISNNKDFIGTISGITADYVAPNVVNMAITVGDYTYEARSINTAPAADTIVTFASTDTQGEGGSFKIQLDTNGDVTVNDQADANTFAARINAALEGVTVYQKRDVTNYVASGTIIPAGSSTASGDLSGSTFDLIGDTFTDVKVEAVRVTHGTTGVSDAVIEFDINGETYRSGFNEAGVAAALGTAINDGTVVSFKSVTDPNKLLQFDYNNAAGTNLDLDTAAKAVATQQALEEAFGIGQGGGTLSFQVGTESSNTINVGLESARGNAIYKDAGGTFQNLDVLTIGDANSGAVQAGTVLDLAIKKVAALRANIGALQSRFDFASSNIESSIQNVDAARANFLDTNVAEESTKFAQSQVRLQASISVLAQANQLPQNLLKLIG